MKTGEILNKLCFKYWKKNYYDPCFKHLDGLTYADLTIVERHDAMGENCDCPICKQYYQRD